MHACTRAHDVILVLYAASAASWEAIQGKGRSRKKKPQGRPVDPSLLGRLSEVVLFYFICPFGHIAVLSSSLFSFRGWLPALSLPFPLRCFALSLRLLYSCSLPVFVCFPVVHLSVFWLSPASIRSLYVFVFLSSTAVCISLWSCPNHYPSFLWLSICSFYPSARLPFFVLHLLVRIS